MKTIIFLSLFFLTFAFHLNGQPKLKLYFNFSKTTYLTGEYEQYEVGAVNVSNSPYKEGWENLILKLTDENGNDVEYKGISSVSFLYWEGQQLEPGEKAYNISLVNDSFGKRWSSLATVDLYLDPGKYTLSGILCLPGGDTSKSEASFQVINPAGEELSVYNSFVNIITEIQKCKDSTPLVNELKYLLDTHPNTVYAPLILDILSANYFYGADDYEKGLNADKELAEKYPWSVRGWEAFNYILDTIKSDSERLDYSKTIHAKSKGTMMEKKYEKILKEFENKGTK